MSSIYDLENDPLWKLISQKPLTETDLAALIRAALANVFNGLEGGKLQVFREGPEVWARIDDKEFIISVREKE